MECHYLTSGPLREGSVIYVEEYLHGKLHKLKLHIRRIEPNARIEYKTFLGTKGVLIIEPRGASSLFTAEMHMGASIPLFRSLVDRIVWLFMSRQLEAIRQHMIEEGQNLKKIFQEGSQNKQN
ncbi:unnamed protein product [marine sediment metagenome]|uniref:Uncharacterized protein n=1 Tax=marine sediment metagenome TaxID=412755 RepID=X1H357_9ZZZZ